MMSRLQKVWTCWGYIVACVSIWLAIHCTRVCATYTLYPTLILPCHSINVAHMYANKSWLVLIFLYEWMGWWMWTTSGSKWKRVIRSPCAIIVLTFFQTAGLEKCMHLCEKCWHSSKPHPPNRCHVIDRTPGHNPDSCHFDKTYTRFELTARGFWCTPLRMTTNRKGCHRE